VSVETIVLLGLSAVAVTIAGRLVAGRTGIPSAALLTVVGIGYALLPGPNINLDPSIVLTVVVPPLLYNAALDSSLLAIRRNLRTVVSLSVALVLATAVVIGAGFAWLVPGASLAAGIALGAAVAPPDPVAALAVGRRVGLPVKLLNLIQGEGLLNDATALTTLTVAVAALEGHGYSPPAAVGLFVVAAAGGVLVGVAVAYLLQILRRLMRDPLITNAISLTTPFAAYLLGEELHVSGVLAVVVAGLIAGHQAPRMVSGAGRLQTDAVWRLVDFLLEGFVFLLIGEQLPHVVRGLHVYSDGTIAIAVAITVGVALLLRPIWIVTTQLLPRSLHTRLGSDTDDAAEHDADSDRNQRPGDRNSQRLTGREMTVLSWAGTRGVISLAAIFTLPRLVNGTPYHIRDLLLFCTFVIVLVTLIGQGLTFGPLVRRLGLRAGAADHARLRNRARLAAVDASLARIAEVEAEGHDGVTEHAIEALRTQLTNRRERYRGRLNLLQDPTLIEIPVSPQYEAALQLRRAAIQAQRDEMLRWRDAGQLPDEDLRILERELDHEERLLPDRPAR
jgi:CPA1 family monovalent cation:H+ antiporter